MGRFIFDLSDDLAQRIEAYRVRRGLKATAQAVRELIELGLHDEGAVEAPRPAKPLRGSTVIASPKRKLAEVRQDVVPSGKRLTGYATDGSPIYR